MISSVMIYFSCVLEDQLLYSGRFSTFESCWSVERSSVLAFIDSDPELRINSLTRKALEAVGEGELLKLPQTGRCPTMLNGTMRLPYRV